MTKDELERELQKLDLRKIKKNKVDIIIKELKDISRDKIKAVG